MKKFLLSLISVLLVGVSFAVAACAPKTDYDNKKVVKIETAYYGGYVVIDSQPTRTFDFESGTVTDELVLGDIWIQSLLDNYIREPESFPEYENYEAYKEFLQSEYNSPKQIAAFSEENAEIFLNKIKSQGVYTWKDEYVDYRADDLRWTYIKIIFSDGTEKRTDFYIDKPGNYKRIQKSFEKYLGESMMWNGHYTEV